MSGASNTPSMLGGQVPSTLAGDIPAEPDFKSLDMGIWSDDGIVWLPKRLYPDRTDAKKFAVAIMDAHWIDVRCRTTWIAEDDEHDESGWYIKCLPDSEGAFECWELYS